MPLDDELASRVRDRFADRVIALARLPPARLADVRESGVLDGEGRMLRLTCTITGGRYERAWDGSEADAIALADEAAEDTAYLIGRTPHYAWLRSRP